MNVEENSRGQNKRDFKEVNLYEEVDFELTKLMVSKTFLGDDVTLTVILQFPYVTNSGKL